MKKLYIAALAVICAIICAFGASACIDPNADNGKDYIVTVLCGDGGTYSLSEPSPVPENIDETLTVTPDQGYEINEVTYNGAKVVLTNENTYTFNVTEDATITISFRKTTQEPPVTTTKYDVSVTCDKENGDYEITAEGEVAENTSVTLTVKPKENYAAEVTVNGEGITLTNNTYTFTVTGDTAIAIKFKAVKKYALSVTCGDNGSCVASAEGEVAENTEITITITPDLDYDIDRVLKNGRTLEVVDNSCTFILDQKTTIDITFKPHVHNYSAWNVSKAPTFENTGSAVRECLTCSEDYTGHSEMVRLDPLTSEKYTIVEGTNTAENCLSTGTAKYSITLDGEEVVFEGESVGEHHYKSSWIIDSVPTLSLSGEAKKVCTVCDSETAGHEIHLELPVLTDKRYSVTGNTAKCKSYGTATYSITLEGQSFTFQGETAPLGHDYSDPNDPTHCRICGEEAGIFESYLQGTWETDVLPTHTLEISLNGIKLDGVDASSIIEDETGNKERMYTFLLNKVVYTMVLRELTYNRKSYYSFDVSYKLADSNIDLHRLFYKPDYPVDFSAVKGYWKGNVLTASFTDKTLTYNESFAYLLSYSTSDTGFTITFKVLGDIFDTVYTLTYNSSLDNLQISYRDAKSGQTTSYRLPRDTEEVTVTEGWEGTYVSDDGAYKIVIDSEGKVTFNDVSVRLAKIDTLGVAGAYHYTFVYDGIVYQIKRAPNKLYFASPALGIEGIELNKQEE